LTSDRSGFREDTPEFETFLKAMRKIIGAVEKVYRQLASRKENLKVMKDSANPRDAFDRQSKLLRDAFRDSED